MLKGEASTDEVFGCAVTVGRVDSSSIRSTEAWYAAFVFHPV